MALEAQEMQKLPMWKKIAYGSGAAGGNVVSTLLARMTRDSEDRTTTSTVSSICNNLAGLVIGTMISWLEL